MRRLEAWANKHPDKLLFSFLSADGNETARYSYSMFMERTQVIGSHLQRAHGFVPETRLLLAYPPGLEMICAFFACVRAGIVPVPVSSPTSHNGRAMLQRMDSIALDCAPAGVLTSHEGAALLTRHLEARETLGEAGCSSVLQQMEIISTEWWLESNGSDTVFDESSDILFLQYTSGSTSAPKGVMVSPGNIIANCALVVDHPAPVAVSWLPQHHDMGLIGYYIYTALTGGTTYGFSPTTFVQRPALWLETITDKHATASSAPNFAFEYCLRPDRVSKETLARVDLSSLRFLMAAAEPIRPNTYLKFLRTFEQYGLKPECFFVAYGLAENTLAVTNYGRNKISVSRKVLGSSTAAPTRTAEGNPDTTDVMSCGKPLGDTVVRIVHPTTHVAVGAGEVGEIWIGGSSRCLGYWNQPHLNREVFQARIVNEFDCRSIEYLRTGDVGFIHDGELHVCGRLKDMIIVRGQNFYPQDIEIIVERTSVSIREGGVAAFEVEEDGEATIAIVAELKRGKAIPDPHQIVQAIFAYLSVDIGYITFVPAKAVPKTSSGKIMRFMAKRLWLEGRLPVLAKYARQREAELELDAKNVESPFEFLRSRYKLRGDELYTLIDVGMGSLDLVIFVHRLGDWLKQHGAGKLASQLDIGVIQELTVQKLFLMAESFKVSPQRAALQLGDLLALTSNEYCTRERALMTADTVLDFHPALPVSCISDANPGATLLTGGTGFLGPFMLSSLIEQTEAPIKVLVRSTDAGHARMRLREALVSAVSPDASVLRKFDDRVSAICADLARPNLGLPAEAWRDLSSSVDTIYHNGASVNYLLTYQRMREVNVVGTNELLRLAFETRLKVFNHISTTFIFGWATKEVLAETDNNEEMTLLDFGYSQSKWVAERLVMRAAGCGLPTRIFRPALVTPSIAGGGSNLDITIRLLAFMLKYGIGVSALNQVSFMPADVVANNVIAISRTSGTLGDTFHVTRDEYSSMVDITNIISGITDRQFKSYPLPLFVPELIKHCTKEDPLFPLLDFLVGSADKISSMEFKRYDNSNYRHARDATPFGLVDPSLKDTVLGILRFMRRYGLA
jgi:thioester reductase-like protein